MSFWRKVRTSAFSMLTHCVLLPLKLEGDGEISVTDSEAVPASLEERILLRFYKSSSYY